MANATLANVSAVFISPATSYTYLFVFESLAIGLCLQSILNLRCIQQRIIIPYTVALLTVGIMAGLIIQITSAENIFENFSFVNSDPTLIMSVFLPVLIFDSAYRLEPQAAFKGMGQILLLAIVGLLITAVVIAGCIYPVMFYGQNIHVWTFSVCLMFGTILCATDPVAVVALLRELGAPKDVVVVTEGESMINDGAAVIVYNIFLRLALASLSDENHLGVGWDITRIAIGTLLSPVVGLIGAQICAFLLQRINDLIQAEILIILFIYITYTIADLLRGSGILCSVGFGIWLSHKKWSLTPAAYANNLKLWDFISFAANTIIFIYSGLEISQPLYRCFTGLNKMDIVYTFICYVFINFARGLTVVFLYPILSRIGYGINWRYATIMVWGGLRGPVSLLLALQVIREPLIATKFHNKIGEKILLYVCGSVALTLLINATTFRAVLHKMKLDELTSENEELIKVELLKLQKLQRTTIQQLKSMENYSKTDWNWLSTAIYLPVKNHCLSVEFSDEFMRLRMLEVIKANVILQYDNGEISSPSAQNLVTKIEETVEKPNDRLTSEKLMKTSKWCRKKRNLSNKHEILVAYKKALEATVIQIPTMSDKLHGEENLISILEDDLAASLKFLEQVETEQPEIAVIYQTNEAALHCFQVLKSHLNGMKQSGLLNDFQSEILDKIINDNSRVCLKSATITDRNCDVSESIQTVTTNV